MSSRPVKDVGIWCEGTFHVPVVPRTREWSYLAGLTSRPLDADELARHAAVVIVTDHSTVDYALVARHARLVIDTRGVYRAPLENVVKA
jgi:UDP-N-acetyl-D-glucosamine dehydrogenase